MLARFHRRVFERIVLTSLRGARWAYPAGYGTWAWTYDAVGNRTQQVAPTGTIPYTCDANNRLI